MNSLGACVRQTLEGQTMNDGTTKKTYEKGDKTEKAEKSNDEKCEKKPPSLSIDRAAFLILRVKKAFKKKRQQRKERQ